MRGAERIILALAALGEPGQATALAERANTAPPPGKNFMGIGLMADIPYQPIVRGVEDMVQSHRQFDDAKTGSQMPARNRNRVNGLIANFAGKLFQFIGGEFPNIRRNINTIQKSFGRLSVFLFRHQKSLTIEIITDYKVLLSPFYHKFGQVTQ